MRLAFMGTPDFSVPTLKALTEGGHDIAAVYTQPPRPAGRGKQDRKSAVHVVAEDMGLQVLTPESMKTEGALHQFSSLKLDAAVVVAYGQLLPVPVLNAPVHGCINVHASLLPRWRGAAPIHRAIMAGDEETGVCIMQMDKGLDTGPVISRSVVAVQEKDTTASLHDRLAADGAALINDALEALRTGTANAETQPEDGVTYAKKIEKAEARLDWAKPAVDIDRQVRGLFPFPGAWTELAGERLKILSGTIIKAEDLFHTESGPGVCLDDSLTIACGQGAYRIERAQRAGKAAVTVQDMLRGFSVPAGTKAE